MRHLDRSSVDGARRCSSATRGTRQMHQVDSPQRLAYPCTSVAGGQTISTSTTDDMSFARHNLSRKEIVNVRADFDDLSNELVADYHGHGNRLLSPSIPLIDVQIGSANSRPVDSYQDIVDTDLRFWNIFQPKPRFRFPFDERFHSS